MSKKRMLRISKLKRIISIVLSFAVVFAVVFMNIGNVSITANAARDQVIKPLDSNTSNFYYIKNVRSGKYLTLENNSTADGTRIVQWHFNAGNNQKWRFEYYGNTGAYGGEYQIVPYNNTNKAIQMVSATSTNGVEARLAPKATDTRQFFNIIQNYTGTRRFVTNASNFTKVLEINGAVVTDGANLIHYSQVSNGSDQFLLEPVGWDYDFGVDYALHQFSYRIMTYPNFNLLNQYYNERDLYQQCNFVSECVCAGGNEYRQYNCPWSCNKYYFSQPSSFSMSDLNTNWNITESWYKSSIFFQNWLNYTNNNQDYSYYDVTHNNYIESDIKPLRGSIVVVSLVDEDDDLIPKKAVYVYDSYTSESSAQVIWHNSSQGDGDFIENMLEDEFENIQNNIRITIINL